MFWLGFCPPQPFWITQQTKDTRQPEKDGGVRHFCDTIWPGLEKKKRGKAAQNQKKGEGERQKGTYQRDVKGYYRPYPFHLQKPLGYRLKLAYKN